MFLSEFLFWAGVACLVSIEFSIFGGTCGKKISSVLAHTQIWYVARNVCDCTVRFDAKKLFFTLQSKQQPFIIILCSLDFVSLFL